MIPPRKRFGNKKRTAKERRAGAVAYLLACERNGIAPDPDVLIRCHGVPANDCAAMLEEARGRRG